MICNFPDDEISLFINRITNIRSHFGLILDRSKPYMDIACDSTDALVRTKPLIGALRPIERKETPHHKCSKEQKISWLRTVFARAASLHDSNDQAVRG